MRLTWFFLAQDKVDVVASVSETASVAAVKPFQSVWR